MFSFEILGTVFANVIISVRQINLLLAIRCFVSNNYLSVSYIYLLIIKGNNETAVDLAQ